MGWAELSRLAVSLTGRADMEKDVRPRPEVQNGFILFVNIEILLSHLGNSNFTEKKKKGSSSCWEMLAFICCYLSNSAWSLLQLTRQQPLGKRAVINASQFLFVHELSVTREGISSSSNTRPWMIFCISLQTHLLSAPEATPIWSGSNGTVVCCCCLSGFI